jgi:cytochrome c-type biogenesis protein CcsB
MPESALLMQEVVLHWAGVVLYALASAAFIYGAAFGRERPLDAGCRLVLAGLVPHAAGLAVRWYASGHGPYMAPCEVLSSNAWVGLAMFLLAARRLPRSKAAGSVVVPVCMLMTAAGMFMNPGLRSLPPSLRSVWLVLHVAFAKLGAGGVLLSFGASVIYLLREARPEGGPSSVQDLETLDAYSLRFAGFGFAFWTIMIAAGAIWANESWGRYWGWDPIEIWSLVTWLLIGIHLHLRRFFGWKGRRAAWTMAACFLMSGLTLFAAPLAAKSLHTEYFK